MRLNLNVLTHHDPSLSTIFSFNDCSRSGYRKDVAAKKQSGEMKSDEGKRPISFSLLHFISSRLISSTLNPADARLSSIAHAFMLL